MSFPPTHRLKRHTYLMMTEPAGSAVSLICSVATFDGLEFVFAHIHTVQVLIRMHNYHGTALFMFFFFKSVCLKMSCLTNICIITKN